MAIYLIIVLLFSVFYLALSGQVIRAKSSGQDRDVMGFSVSYILVVCLTLSLFVGSFLGTGKTGSPRLPPEAAYQMSHQGYYVSPESAFIFTGDKEKRGFKHEGLRAGENVTLQAVWSQADDKPSILAWNLQTDITSRPLRIDRECLNAAPEALLAEGEAVVVSWKEQEGGRRYFALRPARNEAGEEGFRYAQGRLLVGEDAVPSARIGEWSGWKKRNFTIQEYASLYAWTRAALNRDHAVVQMPRWREALQRVMLVRRKEGTAPSGFAVFVDNGDTGSGAGANLWTIDCGIWSGEGKLRKLGSSPDRSGPPIPALKPGSRISIGYSRGRFLSLVLPSRAIEIPQFGSLIEMRLEPCSQWLLPPGIKAGRQFIVSSSREHIPLDGYVIDGYDREEPYYAKAEFIRDGRNVALRINDGRSIESRRCDEGIYLGNYTHGIKIALTRRMPSVPWAGRKAIGIILLSAIIYLLTFTWPRVERSFRPRLDALLTVIWASCLAVLTVRLVLAYRVSLLPPAGAIPAVIKNVFHDSLRLSIWALCLPAALCLVRVAAAKIGPWIENLVAAKRVKDGSKPKNWILFVLLGASAVALILYSFWARNKLAMIGRSSMGAYVGVVVVLVFISQRLWDDIQESKRSLVARWVTAAWPVAVLAIVAVILPDMGLFIYEVSLLFAVAVFLFTGATASRAKRLGASVLAAFLALGVFLVPLVPGVPFIKKFPLPGSLESGFFRLVNFRGAEADLLLSDSIEREALTPMLRNAQQHWQMLHYAAEGIAEPKGYGKAELSDIGMTYPTAMSDCSFSQILLSEHGKTAGLVFVVLLALIGWACLKARDHLPDDRLSRRVPLTAIGTYFFFNTLYMACANLGTSIFTGQNIPFLSLHSGSDVLQGGLLLALVIWLTRENVECDQPQPHDRPAAEAFSRAFLSCGIIIFIFLIIRPMGRLAADLSPFRRDFRFESPEMVEAIKSRMPDPDDPNNANRPLRLQDGKLFRNSWGSTTAIERFAMEDFNSIPEIEAKLSPDSGLFYLDRLSPSPSGEPRYAVRFNERFYSLRSPLRQRRLWRGRLEAAGGRKSPSLLALGYPFSISMSQPRPAETLHLDRIGERSSVISSDKVLVSLRDVSFMELDWENEGLKLYPRHNPGWNLYVDGRNIDTTSGVAVDVRPYDLIVVTKPARIGGLLFSLAYLGPQAPSLAYSQWRNGREERYFPSGRTFPMAYALGRAGDDLAQSGVLGEDDAPAAELALTIDPDLQAETQKDLHEYAKIEPRYAADVANISRTRTISATIMDAYSGELLALPSWPTFDPGSSEFKDMQTRLSSRELSRLYKNGNLRNHSVGSTIKPLVFSTVATGFQGEMDPSRLVIYHNHESPEPDVLCPHSRLAGLLLRPLWDCRQPAYVRSDAAGYLVNSLNYVEAFMGMVGMLMDKTEWKSVRKPVPAGRRPDFSYGGRDYILDLRAALSSPFTLTDDVPAPRIADINRTILFSGLKSLFDVGLSETTSEMIMNRGNTMLPGFFNPLKEKADPERPLVGLNFVDEVIPDPVNFHPKDFEEIRSHLITFFIGGGTCKWNNVHILEALTRVATGRRVTARLQKIPKPKPSPPMPAPLNAGSRWSVENIIEPLRNVGEQGYMAEALKGLVPPPYRAIFKTGTIDEGGEGRVPRQDSETLFFMIGYWEDGKGFKEGETVSCYFYMQDSKLMAGDRYRKHELARPLIRTLLSYLKEKRARSAA